MSSSPPDYDAEAYFINIWQDECSDAERDVLSALATGCRRGRPAASDSLWSFSGAGS